MLSILFLCDDREDYLADSLLHGLITLGSHHIVDYPKKEILYSGVLTKEKCCRIHGKGFTLYGLLPDRHVDRSLILSRLEAGQFDAVILGNIWRQFGLLPQLCKSISHLNTKLLLLDGDDDPRLYPVSLARLKQHGLQFPSYLHALDAQILYAKRELELEQPHRWREMLLPKRIRPQIRHLFRRQLLNPEPCSFSIPQHWIRKPDISQKTQLLPQHIVDTEVQSTFRTGQSDYVFSSQEEYFDDLAQSHFGITSKRAGWDCLRHYEIAASGAVPCFRDLNKKASTCAPHGLDTSNCVIYTSAADLKMQLESMDRNKYEGLLQGSHEWVKKHTTIQAAKQMLQKIHI